MMEGVSTLSMYKVIRFALVGCTGVAIDFSSTYLLKENLKWNKYVASTIGFSLAATNNYILNRLWTFHSADPHVLFQYVKFIVVAVIGVLISNGIVWLVHGRLKVNFYVAKIFSIAVVMVWNFVINSIYTFA